MILLRNVRMIEGGDVSPASLLMDDGVLQAILPPDAAAESAEVRECNGLYAAPGLIEQHAHGANGADVMDCTPEAMDTVCEYHLQHGVTTFYPTTSTDSDESIRRVIDACRTVSAQRAARQNVPGIHIEGQYISEARNGGMYLRYIRNPDPAEYVPLVAYADGWIKRWSIAPELPGALVFGDYCTAHGIVCSVAHSDATYDEVKTAMAHGFRHLTHFYSDMNSVVRINGFRTMGAIEAGYDFDDLWIEVIGDGCHIPPQLMQYLYRHIGPKRMHLVSDSVRVAGTAKEGEYVDVGSRDRNMKGIVEDGVVKFLDRSAFHGSIASGIELLRASHRKAGLPLTECVRMLTANPAEIMRIDDHKGHLKEGWDADVVLFDDDLNLKEVFYRGCSVHAEHTASN